MAQRLVVHPVDPQVRLLRQAAQIIDHGGVAALPTDSCYALVCHLDDKAAADRLRHIRRVDERHHLTLLCRDLSEIAAYAKVDNAQYHLLREATPGPYTFIFEATREVPRRVSHPSRKTIGIRIPDHPVALGAARRARPGAAVDDAAAAGRRAAACPTATTSSSASTTTST